MLGSIFKAYDVRGVYPNQVNESTAWKIGCATGRFLRQANAAQAGQVMVSRDMRPSSEVLTQSLIDGLRTAEMAVTDLGMCDTPIIYFAINHLNASGGVQTTASHNPPQYNGFKISGAQAVPIGGDSGLRQIQAMVESMGEPGSIPPTGKLEQHDLWVPYRRHILHFLQPFRKKVKVVIDASNGMAGEMVPRVFDGVENLEILPLNFQVTGTFAHDPNPLVAENMVPTQNAVKAHGADLGVCFDGDADRCMVVDEQGQIIGCDHLTALLAGYFLEKEAGSTIVYDLRSSRAAPETIARFGGVPRRSRVGHAFMKATLRETNSIFGGELSGHFYYRDNFFADSGAITFAVVLSLLGQTRQTLSELIAPLRQYPQSGEMNFRVDDKDGVMASLKDRYGQDTTVDELDGVTIDAFEQRGYWFNVRPSNTEPLLRLNAEAKDRPTLEGLLSELTPQLGQPQKTAH